jgi:hypothetical protein
MEVSSVIFPSLILCSHSPPMRERYPHGTLISIFFNGARGETHRSKFQQSKYPITPHALVSARSGLARDGNGP